MQRIGREWGGLDILVNNAGILRDRSIGKMTIDEWRSVLDVNLSGVFYCCKFGLEVLRDGGSIVSMGSLAAKMGFHGQANYAAAKAGVQALTRVLARECAERGIRVNAVAPGVIDTPMMAQVSEAARAQLAQSIAMRPAGAPAGSGPGGRLPVLAPGLVHQRARARGGRRVTWADAAPRTAGGTAGDSRMGGRRAVQSRIVERLRSPDGGRIPGGGGSWSEDRPSDETGKRGDPKIGAAEWLFREDPAEKPDAVRGVRRARRRGRRDLRAGRRRHRRTRDGSRGPSDPDAPPAGPASRAAARHRQAEDRPGRRIVPIRSRTPWTWSGPGPPNGDRTSWPSAPGCSPWS